MTEQPSSWILHVEAFVDSARPSNQQATSVDAISALINNDVLTLEELVRGMEQYLTNSDKVIRARGLLLLAEVLNRLLMKSLDSCTVSSLAAFFTAKLEDWYAIRGVLIGCLALLRRTKETGSVEKNDVRMLAESFFRNVAVQSLAVRDRKLALEVLQCLVDIHPQIAMEMGDDLVYDVCYAIDEEKDPRCLMHSFHIVGALGRLFPDSSGPVARFSEDIFSILNQYFPIHFNNPKDDGLDIKKEDLSEALMHAFSSSSFLEPFVVPLLLEKLSSSLPSAKLDSLKYLSSCLCHYGANRMRKHAKAIWSSLKDVIFNFSPQRPSILTNGLDGDVESEAIQIMKEALNCLQTAIIHLDSPNQDSILWLIIDDQDIETKFLSLTSIRSNSGANSDIQRELSALGSVLFIASKVSIHCCTEVFQKFFLRLMEMLGVLQKHSSKSCVNNHKMNPAGFNLGALYLTIELLTSCRELTLACKEIASDVILEQRSWYFVIQSLSTDLCCVFGSILSMFKCSMVVNGKEHVYCAVKGLEVLATFPEFCSPISEATFEDTLVILMSIITSRSEETYLWEISLKALVQIGLWIDNVHDSVKQICFNRVVIERIISILDNVSSIPLSLKLFAISEIGNVSTYVLRITRALEDAIISNLLSCIEGNPKSSESLVPLLDCYSRKVLPRCSSSGNFDSIAIQFAITIWNQMENGPVFKRDITMQNVLDHIMMTMKLLVAGCTVESQLLILQKAHHIVSSMDLLKAEALLCTSSKLDNSQCIQNTILSHRDEWILSLFGSVIIALRPQTPLMDRNVVLNLFMVLLLKGNILAAQSLACMINKWPADIKEAQFSAFYSLDQAIEEILMSFSCTSESSSPMRKCNFVDGGICCRRSVVLGIAWVGKGLLMRGHEKVKDIIMFLLKCLVSGQNDFISSQRHENGKDSELDISSALASAADAFHVLLNDSEDCLNKKFHATVRPLYKQRFFSSILPILLSSIKESDSSDSLSKKVALYRAFGYVISDTPLVAVVAESKKIMSTLVDGLDLLILDVVNKDMIYSLLLVLSGILMDDNGKATIMENLHSVIGRLIKLISYPHYMIVRETAIQCLVAISVLPHARIYPFRSQVLRAVSIALDDRKRAVRQEAVRCRQAWASVATRSLQF